MMLSRRTFLATSAVFTASPIFAEGPSPTLRPVARDTAPKSQKILSETLVNAAGLSGTVGYVLLNLADGQVVEHRNQNALLPPASVTKAMTAAFALDRLGPNHRFTTRLMTTGDIVDGHLHGDLILLGGGDPSLDTDDIVALTQALWDAGIWDITGRFIIDDGGFPFLREIDPGQPPQVDYNPSVAGLNLNHNRIRFDWRRRSNGTYDVDMRAAGQEYRPVINFSRIVPKRGDTAKYTHRLHGDGEMWTVKQSLLGAKGGRWLPTRIPRLYAGESIRGVARAMGIMVPRPELGKMPLGAVDLAATQSAPLTEIAQDMLKYSTNLTAEVLGFAASGQPDLARSSAALSEFGHANGMSGAFVDHSGLGELSRVSPLGLANFMIAQHQTGLRDILKTIPLKARNRTVMGDVTLQAKTGSLNFVSTLSGFIKRGGGDYAFAIMTADLNARSKIKRADREHPAGGGAWAKKSRSLQYALLRNWVS